MRGAWTDLIVRRCGLALREPQIPVLLELVQTRMDARGVTDPQSYFDVLEAEGVRSEEWSELITRLVSHETSFFRHPATFEAVRDVIIPMLVARPHVGGHSLTFWSAGCSTGQEAYSLAMVAAHSAVAGRVTVWGMDISRRAIETARRGVYPARTIEQIPAAYRERSVRPAGTADAPQIEIADAVRQTVRFVCGNLQAEPMFLSYDLIVCQNVLIYFAADAAQELVRLLAARLSPGGVLVFGPGEGPPERAGGLEAFNAGGVRAYRRVGRSAAEVRS